MRPQTRSLLTHRFFRRNNYLFRKESVSVLLIVRNIPFR